MFYYEQAELEYVLHNPRRILALFMIGYLSLLAIMNALKGMECKTQAGATINGLWFVNAILLIAANAHNLCTGETHLIIFSALILPFRHYVREFDYMLTDEYYSE